MNTKTFKGANVFMSRNLVPPEIFDALHDSLKHNGANVFLCCDPTCNGPDDYHVISSIDHEKFEDLRAKGCKLIGPQCVLSCAKEHRPLPQQAFICCLAMDNVKVLTSGFQGDEKVKIGKLIAAMGGVVQNRPSSDVSFVIVKNVLASKYKWASNILKKPIVTDNWLNQCWNEHRIVPQDPYRVPPFSGLIISVSRIPTDERMEIANLVVQNGGEYSSNLTRNCTHLICNISFSRFHSRAPKGDKYMVGRTWGHINIVTRRWLDQSIARRACLNEESYPVCGGSISSTKIVRGSLTNQHGQEKENGNLQSAHSSLAADSNMSGVSCPWFDDPELEATLSQNTSTFPNVLPSVKEGGGEVPIVLPKNEVSLDGCVANDSQPEDDDLYLSACRIRLIGYEASEMRKLVNMVRNGGGSRYMLFNDKLTHIVVGIPSEIEEKEVRDAAASGVIHVVRTTWLEDCDREKKEVAVLGRHMAYDILIPKGFDKGATTLTSMNKMNQGKTSVHLSMSGDKLPEEMNSEIEIPSLAEKKIKEKLELRMSGGSTPNALAGSSQRHQGSLVKAIDKGQQKMQHDSTVQNVKSSCVFKGKLFHFSSYFPEDRRAEIVQWVNQGGGEVIDDHMKQNVHFTIECHGVIPRCTDVPKTTYVSSHWIRSCLEEGCLLDVGSYILYSPLQCQIPLPGFEKFRFCISHYEEKDRALLRNLCFVLGTKFSENLTRKGTHLICKFTNGPKYEAACKWGIHTISLEWIYECVRQNKVVALDSFCPKEVTTQDLEAGVCTISQFPTQAVQMVSRDSLSEFPSQPQDFREKATDTRNGTIREEAEQTGFSNKKSRLLEEYGQKGLLSSGKRLTDHWNMDSAVGTTSKRSSEVLHAIPDVASAIEDLLEQTSKIHDQKSPGGTGCDKNIFSSDCSILGKEPSNTHALIGLSKHWLNRNERKDDITNPSDDRRASLYDGFSETQTDSQIVGYEEDLSGRQMLIDKVRTRSSATPL